MSIFRTSDVQSPHLWLDPNVKILAANVVLMTSVLVFWHCVISSQCHSLFTYSVQLVLYNWFCVNLQDFLQEAPCSLKHHVLHLQVPCGFTQKVMMNVEQLQRQNELYSWNSFPIVIQELFCELLQSDKRMRLWHVTL